MTPEETRELIEDDSSNTTYVGTRTSKLGVEEEVRVKDRKRMMNVLNVGPTGYGKTQMMVHAILQDIRKDHGVAVVNPKGGLIDQVIAKMPEDRHEDIVYINPAREQVTPINVLDAPVTDDMSDAQLENQKEIIVSDMVALFKRYSENWGDRFGRVIETLLRAHLELNIYQDEQNTLYDVFEAASSKDTLGDLADRVRDDVLYEELVTIKQELTDREMEPTVRRLKDFVENKTVKRVIDSPNTRINFREAVEDGKIVLVDIQKGEIGTGPSRIIGTIAITSIWAAVQSRIKTPEEHRTPFYLYIDELQNFAQEGSNLKHILAECREYGLGLWIASQYLNQLSPEMRRAVANNCRTKIFFNPSGSEDISAINGMLQGVKREQLTGLGKYRAVIQTPSQGSYNNATFFQTLPPWKADHSNVEEVKQRQTATGTQTNRKPFGTQAHAGGERHKQLLNVAKKHFQERGLDVELLTQEPEEEKPDGHIHLPDGTVAHLEAESETLTKPGKVLKNLRRAHEQGREVVFIVQEGKAEKLENIVSDPVNRRGSDHEDEHGSYSHYTIEGEPVTDVECIQQADYRIFEYNRHGLREANPEEPECPMLGEHSREDLERFCLYRDDGYCTELETRCILLDDD